MTRDEMKARLVKLQQDVLASHAANPLEEALLMLDETALLLLRLLQDCCCSYDTCRSELHKQVVAHFRRIDGVKEE